MERLSEPVETAELLQNLSLNSEQQPDVEDGTPDASSVDAIVVTPDTQNSGANLATFHAPQRIPTGSYVENAAVLYHHGYGHNFQMTYCYYPPAVTPVPNIGAGCQLYVPGQFHSSATYYHQPVHTNPQYMPSPTVLPPVDVPISGDVHQLNCFVDMPNGNNSDGNCPTQLTAMPSQCTDSGGVSPVTPPGPACYDTRVGPNGIERKGPLHYPLNVSTNQPGPFPSGFEATGFQMAVPVSHWVAATGQLGLTVCPLCQNAVVQTAQQPWLPWGSELHSGRTQSAYPSNREYPVTGTSGFDTRPNARCRYGIDRARSRGRGWGPMSNGNADGNLDIWSEQIRGPRAYRTRTFIGFEPAANGAAANGSCDDNGAVPDRRKYNRADFKTNYTAAKFFIIKSYGEDDIHRSIKYGVWTSTPNGNRKLDAGYREAQQTTGVNGSGQFCGLAEMIGAVDFGRKENFWQRDKWDSCLPVNWIIIKDLPNSLFRRINLESNDNKPVTNSRDTQEVTLKQGLEMLRIFKSYACNTDFLQDFPFYEGREKAMQKQRAKQRAKLLQVTGQSELRISDGTSEDVVKARELKTGNDVVEDENCTNSTLQKGDVSSSVATTSADQNSEDGQEDPDLKPTLKKRSECAIKCSNAAGA